MRILFFLLLICLPVVAFAQEVVPDAPVISFSQQVDIVVAAKKDPRLYEFKIVQEKENVVLFAITDKSLDREEAKLIATKLIMLTKSRSLDDPPKEKNKPGKGLYNYQAEISRSDGIMLVKALKPKAEEVVTFEDPFLLEPLTRADVNGQ